MKEYETSLHTSTTKHGIPKTDAFFLLHYLQSLTFASYIVARAVYDGTDEDLGVKALMGLAEIQMEIIRAPLESMENSDAALPPGP